MSIEQFHAGVFAQLNAEARIAREIIARYAGQTSKAHDNSGGCPDRSQPTTATSEDCSLCKLMRELGFPFEDIETPPEDEDKCPCCGEVGYPYPDECPNCEEGNCPESCADL